MKASYKYKTRAHASCNHTYIYVYICIHTYRCQHCCKQQWNVAGCRSKVRMRVVATVAAVTHTNIYRHTDVHPNRCVYKLHKRTCRCSIWWQFMSKGNVARKAKSILLVMQLECFVVHWLPLVRFVCLFVCLCVRCSLGGCWFVDWSVGCIWRKYGFGHATLLKAFV